MLKTCTVDFFLLLHTSISTLSCFSCSFRESIDLAQRSRTATAEARASLYNLAQALASASSPDDDDDRLLTSEADFWREIDEGGRGEGVAPPFFQQRLHQSASILRARLAQGKHRCQGALDLVTTRASEVHMSSLNNV